MAFASAISGLGIAHEFGRLKQKEDEVRDGSNHWLAAQVQAVEMAPFLVTVSRVAEAIIKPTSTILLQVATGVTIVIAMPACLFLGIVREDMYNLFAMIVNKIEPWGYTISEELDISDASRERLDYLAEHLGDIARIGMAAAGVFFVFSGEVIFGGFFLAAMAYDLAERKGYIPFSVRLFVQDYGPVLSALGMIATGALLSQIIGVISLISLHPDTAKKIHYAIENYLDNNEKMQSLPHPLNVRGPKLSEIDAPRVERKDLSFEEMIAILEAPEDEFSWHPAHFSEHLELPFEKQDKEFDQLMTKFNKIDWTTKYLAIKGAVNLDDRFCNAITIPFCKRRPEFKDIAIDDQENENDPPGRVYYSAKDKIARRFSEVMDAYAQEHQTTKEEFLAQWLTEQMQTCVNALMLRTTNGTVTTGEPSDLAEAIEKFGNILPLLTEMEESDPNEFVSKLCRIAVEGGGYCYRGLKRAGSDLEDQFIGQMIDKLEPFAAYEQKLLLKLHKLRKDIFNDLFLEITGKVNGMPKKLAKLMFLDIHNMDLLRRYLGFGFISLTKRERDAFDIGIFLNWYIYAFIREKQLNEQYSERVEDEVWADITDAVTTEKIRNVIAEHPSLTKDQKDFMINERLVNFEWKGGPENIAAFKRLILVTLGVLKYEHDASQNPVSV